MLQTAGILLGLTALAGMALLALYQWVRPTGMMRLPALAHGAAGVAGFAMLVVSLGGPARGRTEGAGSFGLIAAICFAMALAAVLAAYLARRRGSAMAPLALGLHATLAVAGLTMLVAYLSAPG